jgi:hypothetical protein
MNRAVWKTPLAAGNTQVILPKEAKPIHVATQGDVPCVWWEVDPNATKERRFIATYATGQAIRDDAAVYLGTFLVYGGLEVYHAYEVPSL